MKQNKTKLIFVLIILIILTCFVYADSWTADKPSHSTLYVDTITSKTDASSVNIADTQGLFVTGNLITLGNIGIGTDTPTAKLHVAGSGAGLRVGDTGGNSPRIYLDFGGAQADRRNWAIYTGRADFGDFSIAQSATAGGDPFDGTVRLQISKDGNVGIGTTNPGARLTVFDPNNNPAIRVHAQNNNAYFSELGYWNLSFTAGNSETTDNFIFNVNGGGAWTTGGGYIFRHKGSNLMKITKDGNVGIGTTAPNLENYGSARKVLTIQGSTQFGALELATSVDDSTLDTVGSINWEVPTNVNAASKNVAHIQVTKVGSTASNRGAYMSFVTKPDGGSITERMRIDSNGNVGIGTTNPLAKLHIADPNARIGLGTISSVPGIISMRFGGNYDGIFMSSDNGGDVTIRKQFTEADSSQRAEIKFIGSGGGSESQISLSTMTSAGSFGERLRISGAGNVGIGTANPNALLELNANQGGNGDSTILVDYLRFLGCANCANWDFKRGHPSTFGATINDLVLTDENTPRVTFLHGGNVGIGTTSPQQSLHVIGSIRSSSLAGAGNAYACVNANGDIYRSATPCA